MPKEQAMDWHCTDVVRGGTPESDAADLVLALEDASGSAGEPPAAEVSLSRGTIGDYLFYLSPEAASMARACCNTSTRYCAGPPADLHRCTPMIL
jgi:hypothetical protein